MLVAVAPKQDAYHTLPSIDVNVFFNLISNLFESALKVNVKLTD